MKKIQKIMMKSIVTVLLINLVLMTFENSNTIAYTDLENQDTISDTEGPIIHSMTINKNEVTTGEEVIITLDVTDASGVKSASGILTTDNNSGNKGVTFVKQEDGSFIATIQITDTWVNGTYNFYFIQVYDNYNNSSYINSESDSHPILGSIYFNVYGCISDTEGPIIHSMTINKNEVTTGEEVIITLDVTDPSGVKSASGILTTNNNSGNKSVRFIKQSDGSFIATIQITDTWEYGNYKVYYIEAYDNKHNKSYINSESDAHPILGNIYFNLCVEGHNYDEGTIIRKATCTKEGEIAYTCPLCKKTKNAFIPMDSTNHSLGTERYINNTTLRATTTIHKNVYIDKECYFSIYGDVIINGDVYVLGNLTVYGSLIVNGKLNGLQYNNTLSAGNYGYGYIKNYGTIHAEIMNIQDDYLNLSYEEINEGYTCIQKTDATCTEDGEIVYECVSCHEQKKEIIQSLGHSWNQGTVTTEPKCEEKGIKTFECLHCDEKNFEYIDELGHNYAEEWSIDKEATCAEKGYKSHHCTRCLAIADITEIGKTQHTISNPVKENEIEATVDKEGSYDEVVYCTVCHEEVSRINIITPKKEFLIGDVNRDGKVTLYDAFKILEKAILGGDLTTEERYIMDYNEDDAVTLYDAFKFLEIAILN